MAQAAQAQPSAEQAPQTSDWRRSITPEERSQNIAGIANSLVACAEVMPNLDETQRNPERLQMSARQFEEHFFNHSSSHEEYVRNVQAKIAQYRAEQQKYAAMKLTQGAAAACQPSQLSTGVTSAIASGSSSSGAAGASTSGTTSANGTTPAVTLPQQAQAQPQAQAQQQQAPPPQPQPHLQPQPRAPTITTPPPPMVYPSAVGASGGTVGGGAVTGAGVITNAPFAMPHPFDAAAAAAAAAAAGGAGQPTLYAHPLLVQRMQQVQAAAAAAHPHSQLYAQLQAQQLQQLQMQQQLRAAQQLQAQQAHYLAAQQQGRMAGGVGTGGAAGTAGAAAGVARPSIEQLSRMKVPELKARLREAGVDSSGLKVELVERLHQLYSRGYVPSAEPAQTGAGRGGRGGASAQAAGAGARKASGRRRFRHVVRYPRHLPTSLALLLDVSEQATGQAWEAQARLVRQLLLQLDSTRLLAFSTTEPGEEPLFERRLGARDPKAAEALLQALQVRLRPGQGQGRAIWDSLARVLERLEAVEEVGGVERSALLRRQYEQHPAAHVPPSEQGCPLLDRLPGELLLYVLSFVRGVARDVAALARTCRLMRQIVRVQQLLVQAPAVILVAFGPDNRSRQASDETIAQLLSRARRTRTQISVLAVGLPPGPELDRLSAVAAYSGGQCYVIREPLRKEWRHARDLLLLPVLAGMQQLDRRQRIVRENQARFRQAAHLAPGAPLAYSPAPGLAYSIDSPAARDSDASDQEDRASHKRRRAFDDDEDEADEANDEAEEEEEEEEEEQPDEDEDEFRPQEAEDEDEDEDHAEDDDD